MKPNLECPAPELSRETRAASRAGGWRRKRGAGVGGTGDEGHREVSCVGLLSKDQMIGDPMWPHVDQAMPGPPKSPWGPWNQHSDAPQEFVLARGVCRVAQERNALAGIQHAASETPGGSSLNLLTWRTSGLPSCGLRSPSRCRTRGEKRGIGKPCL